MIRRLGVALLFAIFGFASLVLASELNTWLCDHIAGFCKPYTGPCPGIDTCTPDALDSILLSAIYFGPAVIFGGSGFLFSRRQRSAFAWAALLAGLGIAHALVMICVIQAVTR